MIDNNGCTDCVIDFGHECTLGDPSVCTPKCGDGFWIGSEVCDDGDQSNGDKCNIDCSDSV